MRRAQAATHGTDENDMKQLYYLKGHCGWDLLSLLLAEQIPEAEQLDTALRVLDVPVSGGIEVGLLGRTATPNDIRLRVTDTSTRRWLSMCGGMTQVIGKALVETQLRDHFGIDITSPVIDVRLITDACVIPLTIEISGGKAARVISHMDSYLELTYSIGIRAIELGGTAALDVGEYILIRVQDLEAAHPGIDFTRRDPGPHLDIINEGLKQRCTVKRRPAGANAILYDDRPEGSGQFRVFPRFLDATAARIPYEFQCGTGTIAAAVALAHAGELPFAGDRGELLFEWGSQRTTPDPYGIRLSRVQVTRNGNRLTSASFSHSNIEIVMEGQVRV
jgi:hypothetical protein